MTLGWAHASQLIWVTRGRSWGFRFLLDAGLDDPLPVFEEAFAEVPEQATAWCRTINYGALRLPDPLGRRDTAGRVIPHEFVVLGNEAHKIDSAEEGTQAIWPLVGPTYASIWEGDGPPPAGELQLLR